MVAGVITFGRLRTLRVGSGPAAPTLDDRPVTIVIPARNEASSLPHLLGDLAMSRPAGCRVIVVDDHSTDETAQLASRFEFVTIITAPDLPRGWTGKSWACHCGAQAATDGTLVFLDADVRLNAGAIESIVAEQRATGAVVSVQPFHTVPTWWEQLSGLFNVVAVMGVGAGGRSPNGVFGPVICCALRDYRSIGGHASVRTEVVEDIALGRKFQRLGVPLRVRGGGRDIRFRMYPSGWQSMVEGWTKNMATGAAGTPPMRAIASAVFVCGLVIGSTQLVSVLTATIGPATVLAGDVVGASMAVLTTWGLLRRVGSFRVSAALALPALTAFFILVVARSTWLTVVRRRVTWRGRTIPIGGPALASVGASSGRPARTQR